MTKIYIETTKLYFISLNQKTHYNLITNIIIFFTFNIDSFFDSRGGIVQGG